MKLFTIIFTLVSLGVVVFTLSKVNYSAPFQGDSITALTVSLIGLCAMLLVWILYVSKQVQKKIKHHN